MNIHNITEKINVKRVLELQSAAGKRIEYDH